MTEPTTTTVLQVSHVKRWARVTCTPDRIEPVDLARKDANDG